MKVKLPCAQARKPRLQRAAHACSCGLLIRCSWDTRPGRLGQLFPVTTVPRVSTRGGRRAGARGQSPPWVTLGDQLVRACSQRGQ